MNYMPRGRTLQDYEVGGGSEPAPASPPRATRADIYRDELERREREGKPSSELSRDEQLFRVEMANIEADRRMRMMGLAGNKELSERSAVQSVTDEFGGMFRGYARTVAEAAQTTHKLSGLVGMNTGEGSYAHAMSRMKGEAAKDSAHWTEDLAVGMAGYIADPVWLATYGAGRAGLARQLGGPAKGVKAEIVRDLAAGIPADVLASGLRTDFAGDKMAAEVGYGAAGAVIGNLAMKGIGVGVGKAWKKAFPDTPLPKTSAEAEKALDEATPGWRDKSGDIAPPTEKAAKPKPKAKPTHADDLSSREEALRSAINDIDTPEPPATTTQKALPESPAAKAAAEAQPAAPPPKERTPEFKKEAAELEADGMTRQEAEELLDIDVVEAPAATRVEQPVDARFSAWQQKMEKLTAVDVARKLMGGVKDNLTDMEVRQLGTLRDILMGKTRGGKDLDAILLRAGGVRKPGDAAAKAMSDRLGKLARAGILEPPTPGGAKGRPRSPKERGHAQILSDAVNAGVKAGEWSARHTVSGAKWAFATAGDAVKTMRDFAQLMIGQFGRGIRKHVPEMWNRFKRFVDERNTSRRRSFGGGDFRAPRKDPAEGVSKTAKEKLRAEGRAEAKGAAKGERKVRAEFRAKAVQAVKSAFPIEKGKGLANKESRAARGEYLERVTKAETEAKVRQVLDSALGRAGTMAKRARAAETVKELHKSFFGQKVYRTQASKSKEFMAKINELKHAGIKNPRRGPTITELADMTPEMRKAVVDHYNKALDEFKIERASNSIRPTVEQASDEIAKELEASGRKGFKTKPGAAGPRGASLPKTFFREGQLQPEGLAQAAGNSVVKHVYDKLSKSVWKKLGRAQGLRDEWEAGLKKLGISDPRSQRFINSISGTKAESVMVPLGGKQVEMKKGNFLTLIGSILDSKTRGTLEKGRPVLMPHDPSVHLSVTDADAILKVASKEDREMVELFMEIINRRGMKGKWPSLRDAKDELWRKLTGHDLTVQDDLFPRMTKDEKSLDGADELLGGIGPSAKPEDIGMVKARVDDTKSPIVLGDFLSLVNSYFTRSSALVEMTLPVREIRGVLGNAKTENAMNKYMGSQYVREMNDYVDFVTADSILQKQGDSGVLHRIGMKALHNMNVGLLGGFSIPVATKQFASIYGAASEGISPAHLARGVKKAFSFGTDGRSDLIDRIMEHPVMRARLETHASRLTGEMTGSVGALGQKVGALDKTMALISWMDTNTVSSIYHAVELHIDDAFPGLKKADPAAYKTKVQEKAYEVIRRTQPNFDAVDSSSMQRKSRTNIGYRMVSMFMSPRNTEYNILYRAYKSKSPKQIAKALVTVGIMAPATISLVNEVRDSLYGRQDDEDFESFAKSMGVSMTANNLGRVYGIGPFAEYAALGVGREVRDSGGFLHSPNTPLYSTLAGAGEGFVDFAGGVANGDVDQAVKGFTRMSLKASALAGVPAQPAVAQGKFLWNTSEDILEELGAKEGEGFDIPNFFKDGDGRPTRPDRPSRPERPKRPERPSR
jgi:hypothetical protein